VAAAVPAAPAAGLAAARPAAGGPRYEATIVRTAYGIPHITARSFGSLGYGYGFALASDDLCTMADGYLTVEGQRSRYFGPRGLVTAGFSRMISNLDSDTFWRSVIGNGVISRLLAVRTGPGAIRPELRQLITGYVAGYNDYLASVGGSKGVPDPTCRGKPWVKPITTLDAYLLAYDLIDLFGQASDADAIATARPPASAPPAVGYSGAGRLALPALASSVAGTPPGTGGLPPVRQVRSLGERLAAAAGGAGSNAIAVGSAGTRDHQHGMLLGNPHLPWQGILRLY
jgi:acyl-homoserine-lactone acylase